MIDHFVWCCTSNWEGWQGGSDISHLTGFSLKTSHLTAIFWLNLTSQFLFTHVFITSHIFFGQNLTSNSHFFIISHISKSLSPLPLGGWVGRKNPIVDNFNFVVFKVFSDDLGTSFWCKPIHPKYLLNSRLLKSLIIWGHP